MQRFLFDRSGSAETLARVFEVKENMRTGQFRFPQAACEVNSATCEGGHVVARIWHGYTKPEHAAAYEAMLKPELLPGIGGVRGYEGSYLLRRNEGSEVEFITIILWESIDAIRAFAGQDYETSIVPEERRKYLSRHDAKAVHYEIASTHKPGANSD
jgi:heme-degrading monooxygenase HmoA